MTTPDIDALLTEFEYAVLGVQFSGNLDRVDKAKAAIRALAQPVAAEGWISVDERMPESQSPILLDIGGKHPIRAMWVESKSLPVGLESDDDFGERDEDSDEWYCPAGWYEWNQHEECHWRVGGNPTHWMPLPAPPTPA